MLAFIPMFIASAVVLVAVPAAVHRRDALLRQAAGPQPVRLGDAGVVGAVDQPGVHHHPGRRVRRVWTKLGDRQPSTPVKFALGTIDHGRGVPAVPAVRRRGPNSAPLLGLVGILFVFTIAELLISPVGLSLATKLAPRGIPHADGGAVLPVHRARHRHGRACSPGTTTARTRSPYFGILGGIAIVIGTWCCWLITPPIKKLMSGVR